MELQTKIELTAGKLLAENCDPKTIDVKTALLKISNCVGFHLLENVITNNFDQVKEQMFKMKNR